MNNFSLKTALFYEEKTQNLTSPSTPFLEASCSHVCQHLLFQHVQDTSLCNESSCSKSQYEKLSGTTIGFFCPI